MRFLSWAKAPHAGGSSLGWSRCIALEPEQKGTLLLMVAVLRKEGQQQLGIPFVTFFCAAGQESLSGTRWSVHHL